MRSGFVEVSKERFHATVGQLDVVLRSEPDCTFWERRNREVLGITYPGYLGGSIKKYTIVEYMDTPHAD